MLGPRFGTHHLVSLSGGKDSTACLLLALKQFPGDTSAVFADTGNEHEATHEYIGYLERELGIRVTVIRQDFTEWWWRRRDYIRDEWPSKGVPDAAVARALAVFEAGPTGNPYLDLCIIKGRFPGRMAQFCTQHLKTQPLYEHAMTLHDLTGADIWSWQGVRRDESAARARAAGFEQQDTWLYVNRPIVGWTAQQTVDFVRSCGIKLNPLYEQGMARVGCMPCINAGKAEIAEIARRFPEHVERIAEWERVVSAASKRCQTSFFPAPEKDAGRVERFGANIHGVVLWARTLRGGKEADPAWDQPAPACSSSYGLCE